MSKRATLNVSLTRDLSRYVEQQVHSGRYQSASDMVKDGLRMLRDRDYPYVRTSAELQRAVAVGEAQLRQGKTVDADLVFNRIRSRLKKKVAAQRRRKAG
jgi:antitoxin ParD1/3/4